MNQQPESGENISQLADDLLEIISRLDVLRGVKEARGDDFVEACIHESKEEAVAAGVRLIRANIELNHAINQREGLSYKLAQLALRRRQDGL